MGYRNHFYELSSLRIIKGRASALSRNCLQCVLDSAQTCPLSQILFVILMEGMSRRSRGEKGIWFGNLRIASLLFADDLVLKASSSKDLQLALERFVAECEVAGMGVSSSKSEAMVLKAPVRPQWLSVFIVGRPITGRLILTLATQIDW